MLTKTLSLNIPRSTARALAPEKYRERAQVDHSGRVGMVIGIDIVPPESAQ